MQFVYGDPVMPFSIRIWSEYCEINLCKLRFQLRSSGNHKYHLPIGRRQR